MSRMEGMFTAWGRILGGRTPNLSIEITRECPLALPRLLRLRRRSSRRRGHAAPGRRLQGPGAGRRRMLQLVDEHRPLHLSIVGGEPLVRFRELNTLLPILAARGIHTQLVTSAVRPIPIEWAQLPRLQIVVSIDGLQPEHDVRRTPATYDRILKHIVGHQITVHCTVTRQQVQRDGYLEEFLQFWSANRRRGRSGSACTRRRSARSRAETADARPIASASSPSCWRLRASYPKLEMPEGPDRGLREAPVLAGRVRVRADHDEPCRPTSSAGSRRASSAASRTAPTAAASPSAGLAAVARHQLSGCISGRRRSSGRRCGSASGCAGPRGPGRPSQAA